MQIKKYLLQITFGLALLVMVGGALMLAANTTQAAPVLQESGDDAAQDNPIFIPFIAGGPQTSAAEVPMTPEQYVSTSEEGPEISAEDAQSATWCSSYIKFRNDSSYTIKIYYKSSYNETLYKTLSSGTYYWQHTYYGNDWKVRDTDGNLLKSFSANSCFYMYVTIDNNDFPQPTPTPTPTTPSGGACYTEIIAVHSNKCMDVSGWSTSNNAQIQQYSCSGGDNQKFFFSAVPGKSNTYLIRAKHSGKAVDVLYGSSSAGKDLVQYSADGSSSQQWKIVNISGDIYELKNINSGLVADVEGSSTSNGAHVIQWYDNSTSNQRWKIPGCLGQEPTPTPTNTSQPTPTNTPQPTPTNTPAPQLGSIGDRVWNDLDRDGIQDNGEPGAANVTVQLKDCSGNVITSQSTDGNGNYTFGSLAAACYSIGIVVPNGYQISPKDQGTNDNTDSDINIGNAMSDNINLGAGQNITNIDAGINQPAQNGVIGDKVFRDDNGNGQQDAGEPGVSGVTVDLKDCSGNSFNTPTTTNANGIYSFSGLAAGCYTIGVTLPGGYTFSPQNVGNDNTDSDVNPSNGMSDPVNLAAGQTNNTVDAGLIPQPTNNASLGDKVFRDDNGNGQQDAGEPGVSGVTVDLKDCSGNSFNTPTTTNANGIYSFSGLAAGCYTIGVTLPGGYTFSPQNVGNDNTDSDVNQSNGMSDPVNLAAGQTNNTIDAGLVPESTGGDTCIGDYVWYDMDMDGLQDANEMGTSGVTIYLGADTNGDGRINAYYGNTQTDANGSYSFCSLNPSITYSVEFVPPMGCGFTLPNVGSDDTIDSDPDISKGVASGVVVVNGTTNDTIDAGLVCVAD